MTVGVFRGKHRSRRGAQNADATAASAAPAKPLLNPYYDFFRTLPASYRRDPSVLPSTAEWMTPDWLAFKAAIARHFAWAVPTEDAIAVIRKYAASVVEIGAGSGYWTWLMRQAGITVVALDVDPPAFTWSEVARGDENAVRDHPDKALLLCWPPWATDMAAGALTAYGGEHIVYVGEWMAGNADANFFSLLTWNFECIDQAALPQWYMRDDRLMVFRRRRAPAKGPR